MLSTTYTALRKQLSGIMDKVSKDREVLHITRKGHETMVMLTEADYKSMEETLYLSSNNNNARRLEESFQQPKNRDFVEVNLDED
ncbi:MAG: type II toxin-antitoxin system Phd/YefM family antitoxin [Flavobacteriales bacterium]|nr:type II toxin-antitoxin system Phd/YefM family antitoxin [Flavobacteriales bacterium]